MRKPAAARPRRPVTPPAPPPDLASAFAGAVFSVEMVPEPLWALSLKKSLDPARWSHLRAVTLAAAGHRCAACAGDGADRPLQCHERWDYDDIELVQRLVGLQALCEPCHLAKTPGRAAWLAARDVRYAHLPEQVLVTIATLNGWDRTTAVAYVRWCGAVNTARAAVPWTQDVSRFVRAEGEGDVVCPRCFLLVPPATADADDCVH